MRNVFSGRIRGTRHSADFHGDSRVAIALNGMFIPLSEGFRGATSRGVSSAFSAGMAVESRVLRVAKAGSSLVGGAGLAIAVILAIVRFG